MDSILSEQHFSSLLNFHLSGKYRELHTCAGIHQKCYVNITPCILNQSQTYVVHSFLLHLALHLHEDLSKVPGPCLQRLPGPGLCQACPAPRRQGELSQPTPILRQACPAPLSRAVVVLELWAILVVEAPGHHRANTENSPHPTLNIHGFS